MLHYSLEYLTVVFLDDLVAFLLDYCLQSLWYGVDEIITQSLVVGDSAPGCPVSSSILRCYDTLFNINSDFLSPIHSL